MDIQNERKFPWSIVFGLGLLLLIVSLVADSDLFKSTWEKHKEQTQQKTDETFDSYLDRIDMTWSTEKEVAKAQDAIKTEIITWPGYTTEYMIMSDSRGNLTVHYLDYTKNP